MTGLSDGTIIDNPAKRGVLPSSRTSKAFGERSSGYYTGKTAHKSVGIVGELFLLLFFFFLNIFEGQLKESQTHIVVWHLSVWEEVTGILQNIIISDTLCQIKFADGINICTPLPEDSLLQRLKRARCKIVSICRTDIPARRYLFNFHTNVILCNNSSSIRQMGDEEIVSLKALYGWPVIRKTTRKRLLNIYGDQQQFDIGMGGQ